MTEEDFITRIRKEYLRARKVLIDDSKIIRGTSHSISSLSEDVFAKYIADLIPENYAIWIDPQISVKNVRNASGKRVKTFRPDVCVYNINEQRIELVFDLKMDLGYKRANFINDSMNRHVELMEIIQHNGSWNKNGSTIKFRFSKNLKWNHVVLSEENITKKQTQVIKKHFLKNTNSELFILSSGEHLNSYDEKPKIEINEKAFRNINSIVNKACG